jgi:hypothetical protein
MGPGMHDSWMYGGFGMWLWPVLVIGLIIALIVPLGEWEKNPRLQAKTSVGP